jgi:hypothetical protein
LHLQCIRKLQNHRRNPKPSRPWPKVQRPRSMRNRPKSPPFVPRGTANGTDNSIPINRLSRFVPFFRFCVTCFTYKIQNGTASNSTPESTEECGDRNRICLPKSRSSNFQRPADRTKIPAIHSQQLTNRDQKSIPFVTFCSICRRIYHLSHSAGRKDSLDNPEGVKGLPSKLLGRKL